MSMVTADYHYPDWGCLVDIFFNPGLKNCWHGRPGIEFTTLYLSSQSGAYDLSATVWTITGYRFSHFPRTFLIAQVLCYLRWLCVILKIEKDKRYTTKLISLYKESFWKLICVLHLKAKDKNPPLEANEWKIGRVVIAVTNDIFDMNLT